MTNECKKSRLLKKRALRFRMIHEGLLVRETDRVQGINPRTAYKWLKRHREEGEAHLFDHNARHRHSSKKYKNPERF